MGRPVIGKGAKVVPVTIERGLFKLADFFAKRHGLERSQMDHLTAKDCLDHSRYLC